MKGDAKYAGFGRAIALAAMLIAPAVHADGTARGPRAVPQPVVSSSAFNWGGFYAGGQFGSGWSSIDHTSTFPNGRTQRFSFDADSAVGGLQFGVQRQWSSIVVGLEADLHGGDFSQEKGVAVFPNSRRRSDIDWLFTLTPRLGYAVDRYLFYVKGGYANAGIFGGTTNATTGNAISSTNRREDGWTIGGGFEMAVASWVTLGLDYSYVSIDPHARPASPQLNALAGAGVSILSDAEIHLLMSRINFKLGNP